MAAPKGAVITSKVLALNTASLAPLIATIAERTRHHTGPYLIGIDGRSGSGKSTFAAYLASQLNALLISGDDFYAGGVDLRADPPQILAADCIDWPTQRAILETLLRRETAQYRAFDWDAFDGSLAKTPTVLIPRPIVILEGTYSARPQLRDLLNLSILIEASDALRRDRLILREGEIGPWVQQWHRAEDWYFAEESTPASFDLIITSTEQSWTVNKALA